ncbi:MAG: hypothetical protein WCC22_08685 [Terriglobales bacterium]
MSATAAPEVIGVPEVAQITPNASPERSYDGRQPLFTAEQQEIFNRAFAKRERKVRAEYESMRRDLLETVALLEQLLPRCRDRIGIEDQRAILNGVNAIRLEYEEHRKCQKPH